MLHQLVPNFVCQPVGAWQEVYAGFIGACFDWKQLPAAVGNKTDESSETEPKQ